MKLGRLLLRRCIRHNKKLKVMELVLNQEQILKLKHQKKGIADLEAGAGIPLASARFGAVLVFRYLWRPLAPAIEALLRPGGILLYETFTRRQKDLPHGPGNAAFLLGEGELARLFPGLRVETFEEAERRDADGRAWHLASLLARKP